MVNKFIQIQCKILAAIAWADNNFDSKELTFYENILSISNLSVEQKTKLLELTKSPVHINDVIEEIKNVPVQISFSALKNGYVIAKISNDICSKEQIVIYEIAKLIGITEDKFEALENVFENFYKIYQLEEEIFLTIN